MIELRIEDVEILDNIILELCKKSSPNIDFKYLRDNWIKGFNEKFLLSDRDELIRLSSIIESFDCAEIFNDSFSPIFIKRNSKTLQFEKQGGFKNEYLKLVEKSRIENIELKLAESNIKANKLNKKVAKRNKNETIINIIIGLINIGILIWQSLLIVKSSK